MKRPRFVVPASIAARERATGQQDIAGRLAESVAQVKPVVPDTCTCGCGAALDPLALMAGATVNTVCGVSGRARAHQKAREG
jgi:hypothetical protein